MNAIIYQTKPQAKRIKFHLPYQKKEWRVQIKSLNSSFYHKQQRLWSVINTPEMLESILSVFGKEYQMIEDTPKRKRLYKPLTDEESLIINKLEKAIILKGYSSHTLKSYRSEMISFLTYHRGQDLRSLDKQDIESYIYHLVKEY